MLLFPPHFPGKNSRLMPSAPRCSRCIPFLTGCANRATCFRISLCEDSTFLNFINRHKLLHRANFCANWHGRLRTKEETSQLADIEGAQEYALAKVAQPILGNAGRVLVGLAALMATSSAINSTLFGASRMIAEMAEQGMMPHVLAVRDRRRVPWVAVVLMVGVAMGFTLLGSLRIIAEFSSLTFLLVSIGVSLANIKLRRHTGARLSVAGVGLVLMALTVSILLAYLWNTNRGELILLLLLYGVVALVAFVYIRRANIP